MTEPAIALGIIPARAHSSRFPFKMIEPLLGKPLVQYVWENALKAKRLSRVIVATDHREILKTVESFGGQAVFTPEFQSGSDRVAFLAKDVVEGIIVNIQGDEPLLQPAAIDAVVNGLLKNPTWDIATLAVPCNDPTQLNNPNCVKVVVNGRGEALYFSRAPLMSELEGNFLKHIGIYAYRKAALLKFCALPLGRLEKSERLEQLRALENGMRMGVEIIQTDTVAVDTPEDLEKVKKILNEEPLR